MAMNITIQKPTAMPFHPQTRYLFWGISLPIQLVFLGTYLLFSAAQLVAQVQTYLANFSASATPWIYTNILFPMSANGGLSFKVLGALAYVLSLALAYYAGKRWALANTTFGNLRLRSVVMVVLVSLIWVAIIVSLANVVLFDPLLALQAA